MEYFEFRYMIIGGFFLYSLLLLVIFLCFISYIYNEGFKL